MLWLWLWLWNIAGGAAEEHQPHFSPELTIEDPVGIILQQQA
jgi:hypothetical protein